MSEVPIAEYGFLSDCRSAALVSRAGSIDWWCPARFDSPSVFARLLDADGGHWMLGPAGQPRSGPGHRVERAYVRDTLVLRTVHHTPGGSVAVTDALVTEPGARGHELGHNSPAVLLRVVEGLTGTVRMRTEFAPRHDYGLLIPYLHSEPEGVVAAGGPTTLVLRGAVPFTCLAGRAIAEFDVPAGRTVGFTLAYAPAYGPPPTELDPLAALADTVGSWRSLREKHAYHGRYEELVTRSALVLQGLTYVPSGAVVAAATTSLPERIGGERNYDYRFAWLRDFSLTLNALWVAACPDETSRLLGWAARSVGLIGHAPLPIMHGVAGERDVAEHRLDHLSGYAGSRPVRAGNDAFRQRQLDVPGELLLAVYQLREHIPGFEGEMRDMLVGLADQVTATWRQPDSGMWEHRDQERHYVTSKVLCWSALDCAVRLAPRLGETADPRPWAAARDEVRAAVLEHGWNPRAGVAGEGAFTRDFDSAELDASVLILPLARFLPATDPRMWATIRAIERELTSDGLVRRWPGDPAGFVLCTFWLVECLALAGEQDRARVFFEHAAGFANDVGLLAEQVDPVTGAQLGNFPQALSHIGLINAAWQLEVATRRSSP